MASTIKEIAKLANVSRGTVDRALNNRPGVNSEVAQRIKEIAKAMDYKPNSIAKALASRNRQFVIGVLINSIGNPFFDEVLRGIHAAEKEIADFGFTVKLQKMQGYNADEQLEQIRAMERDGMDAFAITPVSHPKIRSKLNQLISQDIPVVCFNLDISDVNYLAYVGCDYFKSGQTLGQMIGFITGEKAKLAIIAASNNLDGHRLRVEGCKYVLKNDFPESQVVELIEAEDNDEIAYVKTLKMLQTHKEINALCFNAGGTKGGLQAVRELGLENQLDIFTFDLTPTVIESINQGIVKSTVVQQPYMQGYQAIKILFNAVLNNEVPENDHIYTDLTVKIKYSL